MFLAVGFSITHTVVFLHIFHWFRILISGMDDYVFNHRIHGAYDHLHGFRQRYLGRLVRCHACMGFWIGVVLSILYGGFITKYMSSGLIWIDVICDGFLLSGFNFFIWLVFRKLGAEEL
jgi:hypothetical protein